MVTAPLLLQYYEREKDLVIQCDAGEGGLIAALLQDGRAMASASRGLTAGERKYTQIKRNFLQLCFQRKTFTGYSCGRLA